MNIAGRELSAENPYIVAELSGEHCGFIGRAKRLIEAAKDAGADAAKLQCFDPVKLAELRGGVNKVCDIDPWMGVQLGELYERTHTPREWFPQLFDHAARVGITLFSSVFDPDDVDFLETLGCPAYKISAYEAKNHDLIDKAKSTGKPIIVSGHAPGCIQLHCISQYPCPPKRAHLAHMVAAGFDGFSDHTEGILAAVVAAALGAKVIEKHLTLSRSSAGPDASFALEQKEFLKLTQQVRLARQLISP